MTRFNWNAANIFSQATGYRRKTQLSSAANRSYYCAPISFIQKSITQPKATIIGIESTVLTDFLKQQADHFVRIPMAGQASSLNIASAASVLVFEAVRQRLC